MTDTSILLLGAKGQVGHELARILAGPNLVALDLPRIDFARPESLRAIVREFRPTYIVNAAAYTAVDKAEREPDLAYAVNAAAPAVLAEEASALGARLIHYSTDYVFDGRKRSPYIEEDTPAPLSVYGRTKLEGERAVTSAPRHLIFRTSWVVGAHGDNFIKTVLRLAAERETLKVVDDQYGAPTPASLLASMTAHALSRPEKSGLYHLVSAGSTTWHGLALHVVKRAAAAGVTLKTVPAQVLPISTSEYPTAAVRPANSRLETTKFCNDFRVTLPDWRVGVDAVLGVLLPKVAT